MLDDDTTAANWLRVRGARVHNLKSVDFDLPWQKLVVLSGVSGSGKSSIAHGVIQAEGQRRFCEGASAAVKSKMAGWSRPNVDFVDGLPPTVSVRQSALFASSRSTVASTTEVLDYLRVLFARCGQAHCPNCHVPVSASSVVDIVEKLFSRPEGEKVVILAPLADQRRGSPEKALEEISRSGFVRMRVDGQMLDVSAAAAVTDKSGWKLVDAVVDRVVVKAAARARIRESVEVALKHGAGVCVLCTQAGTEWVDERHSSRFECLQCGFNVPELEPRTLSFNSAHGACPTCRGLGVDVSLDNAAKGRTRIESSRPIVCCDCGGSRLNLFARSVQFSGVTLPELLSKTVAEACDVIAEWQAAESRASDGLPGLLESRIVAKTLPTIRGRLEFLKRVGAGYLALSRATKSLSGGEHQKARLAACLGSGLVGVAYVLDEPTIGLHAKDTAAMIDTLHALRDQGNTVIVVEHDLTVIREADYLVDVGPGSGADGGEIIARGTPSEVARNERSITGRYLNGALPKNSTRASPFDAESAAWLTLSRVSVHNLRDVTARIPIGALTVVTGVSGSGKTSLIHHALVPLVRSQLDGSRGGGDEVTLSGHRQLDGLDRITRLVEVTQAPLGRTSTSNPATYSGLWDEVCRLLAQTRDARLRGFRPSRFRFNSPSGQCSACRGRGTQRLRMKLLPDVSVTCPACRGERFNAATLKVRFNGRNAADVLRLRIRDAAELFANIAKVQVVLNTFCEVGLGYMPLGQPATTLSGGEAQRVKLATELSRESLSPTLFVLDEPTTGLHPADIERLLALLQRLVQAGHTVLVIEHNLDVIAQADWLIDLGPDGGEFGGQIVATGSPQQVAQTSDSHTAKALREHQLRARRQHSSCVVFSDVDC